MPLSVDPRKIVRASVIPWEGEQKLYGIAYETSAGWHGADKIGTKAEAEAVLRSIGLQQSDSPSGVVEPFPKSIAAS
jgi:hypothetical protein